MPLSYESPVFFRQIPGKGSPDIPIDEIKDETDREVSENGKHIRCRQCRLVITRESERIQINGTHQHVCTNPHGIVFEIGCFRIASGCSPIGSPSDEWSWFPGFSWKVAVCRRCLSHLGWLFTASTPDNFYGLILNRLRFAD